MLFRSVGNRMNNFNSSLFNNDLDKTPPSKSAEVKMNLQPLCEFTTLVFKREIRFLRLQIFTTTMAIIAA